MFTVEEILTANPEFREVLFTDLGFVKYVDRHLHDPEYQIILMQRTQLTEEQQKILSELKSNEMFIDWKYTQSPSIKIQDVENPAYQRYLIEEYACYKKSWLGKIKQKLIEFNIKLQKNLSPEEFSAYYKSLLVDILDILFPTEIRTLIDKYFTAYVTNAACSIVEMKRSLSLRNVALFIIAHAALIAAVPAYMFVKLMLIGLTLASSIATSIIININFSIMAFTYFFGAEENITKNESNVDDGNILSKFFTLVARGFGSVLKAAVSVAVPLLLLTLNIIGLALITLAIIPIILHSLRSMFACYVQTYKFQSEKEANEAKLEESYKEKLKTYANENKIELELSSLHQLLNKPENVVKFIMICDATQIKLKSAIQNGSFRNSYKAIHDFQGLLSQFEDSLKIQNNSSIVIIKDLISTHGPLALNCSINAAPPLNDEQKSSIALLIKIFDSILKDKDLFIESKDSTELPQSSTIINSFKICRKLQPEHVMMVSNNENQLNITSKFNMVSAKLYSQRNMNNTKVNSKSDIKTLTM